MLKKGTRRRKGTPAGRHFNRDSSVLVHCCIPDIYYCTSKKKRVKDKERCISKGPTNYLLLFFIRLWESMKFARISSE